MQSVSIWGQTQIDRIVDRMKSAWTNWSKYDQKLRDNIVVILHRALQVSTYM